MPTTFASILPVKQITSHSYTFTLKDDWCTGTVPSGGYIASAFLITARTHMQLTHNSRKQLDVINLHLEYLRRSSVGQAIITVQDVKLGSRISNLHLALSQRKNPSNSNSEIRNEIQGYATMSSMTTENGTTLATEYRLLPSPLPVDLQALSHNRDPNYILRRPDAFSAYRRAAGNVQMYQVRPAVRRRESPPSVVDLWARMVPLRSSKPGANLVPGSWTNDALGFLVDIFTAINEKYVNAEIEDALLTESITDTQLKELIKNGPLGSGPARFWYPTLLLNLDVKKKLPEPTGDGTSLDDGVVWLFVRVQAKKVLNGRMDLAVEVWDETGDLVALSSQASLIMDAGRNTTREKRSQSKI